MSQFSSNGWLYFKINSFMHEMYKLYLLTLYNILFFLLSCLVNY